MSLVWPLLADALAVMEDVERDHPDDPEHDPGESVEEQQYDVCLCHGCVCFTNSPGLGETRTIHESRCEAFDPNVRRGFSQARLAWP